MYENFFQVFTKTDCWILTLTAMATVIYLAIDFVRHARRIL